MCGFRGPGGAYGLMRSGITKRQLHGGELAPSGFGVPHPAPHSGLSLFSTAAMPRNLRLLVSPGEAPIVLPSRAAQTGTNGAFGSWWRSPNGRDLEAGKRRCAYRRNRITSQPFEITNKSHEIPNPCSAHTAVRERHPLPCARTANKPLTGSCARHSGGRLPYSLSAWRASSCCLPYPADLQRAHAEVKPSGAPTYRQRFGQRAADRPCCRGREGSRIPAAMQGRFSSTGSGCPALAP